MNNELRLSTKKLCPKCGCDSLEEYLPLPATTTLQTGIGYWDKHYHCVALCGISFGLRRLKNGKIKIGYNNNEKYLKERFKFTNSEGI